MNRFQQFGLSFVVWYIALSLLTVVTEFSIISPEQRLLYFGVKLGLIAVAIPIFFALRKNFNSPLANLTFGFSIVAYALWGEIFRGLYSHVFFIAIFLYALIFPVSRRIFAAVVGFGTIAFIAYYLRFWSHYQRNLMGVNQSDMTLIVFESVILAVVAFHILRSERQIKTQTSERYALIGKLTATLVHDLKNMMSSPQILVQEMQQNSGKRSHEENLVILDLIERHLNRCNEHIRQLSTIPKYHHNVMCWFDVRHAIDRAYLLLGQKAKALELNIVGQAKVFAELDHFETIFFHLLQNTANHSQAPSGKLKVEILFERSSILYMDNGGGFPREVLRNVQNSNFLAVTGFGLYFVFDLIQRAGGKIKIENQRDEAHVEITLPRKKYCMIENS